MADRGVPGFRDLNNVARIYPSCTSAVLAVTQTDFALMPSRVQVQQKREKFSSR